MENERFTSRVVLSVHWEIGVNPVKVFWMWFLLQENPAISPDLCIFDLFHCGPEPKSWLYAQELKTLIDWDASSFSKTLVSTVINIFTSHLIRITTITDHSQPQLKTQNYFLRGERVERLTRAAHFSPKHPSGWRVAHARGERTAPRLFRQHFGHAVPRLYSFPRFGRGTSSLTPGKCGLPLCPVQHARRTCGPLHLCRASFFGESALIGAAGFCGQAWRERHGWCELLVFIFRWGWFSALKVHNDDNGLVERWTEFDNASGCAEVLYH